MNKQIYYHKQVHNNIERIVYNSSLLYSIHDILSCLVVQRKKKVYDILLVEIHVDCAKFMWNPHNII
jgi:hypothetical protein